ncbi:MULTISPECIES: hypothetical protein [Erwiniaceae]|uniref:Uncharacterized protein n=1 Tax=Pantoea coffeiphila TaxID=1465635 RepID=A0A2S9I5Q4_9GAMM|nr:MULTISPECIES: hypothetical protein [Erwiniaceae]MCW1877627.1 hypothetical protein [Erwinia sp. INIA01]PRD13119.1 hypothetical protein CQW29_22870 [Pantoea coffeiphila]
MDLAIYAVKSAFLIFVTMLAVAAGINLFDKHRLPWSQIMGIVVRVFTAIMLASVIAVAVYYLLFVVF